MTVPELIQIARTRLTYLAAQRETAVRLGDEVQIADIDKESAQTQETLNQLLTLV
jgi:hypothetical protein